VSPGRPLVVVLCRPPDSPDSKTRLALEVGRENATAYYVSCLQAVLGTLGRVDVDLRLAVAGNPIALAALASDLAPTAELVRQVGKTFAERQAHEIARGLADGHGVVVLCASDLPRLPIEAVTWALEVADRGDVGMVPSHDGGYSLLSTSRPLPGLAEVPMSMSDTGAQLARLLQPTLAPGRRVVCADLTVRDLDVLADLTA
jgi:glycosyltransferase A (GT-A) superfamily protein (DUF2064 family)